MCAAANLQLHNCTCPYLVIGLFNKQERASEDMDMEGAIAS